MSLGLQCSGAARVCLGAERPARGHDGALQALRVRFRSEDTEFCDYGKYLPEILQTSEDISKNSRRSARPAFGPASRSRLGAGRGTTPTSCCSARARLRVRMSRPESPSPRRLSAAGWGSGLAVCLCARTRRRNVVRAVHLIMIFEGVGFEVGHTGRTRGEPKHSIYQESSSIQPAEDELSDVNSNQGVLNGSVRRNLCGNLDFTFTIKPSRLAFFANCTCSEVASR